jgi:hypothetical protein
VAVGLPIPSVMGEEELPVVYTWDPVRGRICARANRVAEPADADQDDDSESKPEESLEEWARRTRRRSRIV